MTTTITEEFDGEGRLTKRTTVTDGYATGGYVAGPLKPAQWACVCGQPWNSVTPRTCPAHPYLYGPPVSGSTITVSSDTSASPDALAQQISWAMRGGEPL